jgi:hypothetical protein
MSYSNIRNQALTEAETGSRLKNRTITKFGDRTTYANSLSDQVIRTSSSYRATRAIDKITHIFGKSQGPFHRSECVPRLKSFSAVNTVGRASSSEGNLTNNFGVIFATISAKTFGRNHVQSEHLCER